MYNSVMYNANKSTAGTDRVKQAMALAMALAFASMVSLVALPVMAQDDP